MGESTGDPSPSLPLGFVMRGFTWLGVSSLGQEWAISFAVSQTRLERFTPRSLRDLMERILYKASSPALILQMRKREGKSFALG